MKQVLVGCFVAIFFLSIPMRADVLSETFNSSVTRSYFPASPLIPNQALGVLHPPLQISSLKTACDGATSNSDVDFGDGSMGSFNSTTYSRFGTVTGAGPYVIWINTNVYSTLNLTDFNLASGDTIYPTGTNPLVIKSLSDISINGIIDCKGASGTNASASSSTLSAGGTGRCGGGNGGNGATSSSAATAGSAGIATVISGGGAASGSAGAGGAGGAGFNWTNACGTPGTQASNGAGAGGGVATANYEDSAFRNQGGGAGGGGGAIGGGFSGAGGGAGGGHIEIYAARNITVALTGKISVNGGNGGVSAGGSGGGGGGAAGSIRLAAGGTINVTVGGTSLISIGSGGTGGTSATGSAGGNGASGRDWLTDSLGDACFSPECELKNQGISLNNGTVLYKTGLFTSTTGAYDLRNYHTTLTNLSQTVVNSGSGTVTISVDGSRNGFSNDSTGFQNISNISVLNGSRYIRFKVDLNNTVAATPITLDQIDVTYTPGAQKDFNYTSGCGTIGGPDPKIPMTAQYILSLILLLILPILSWISVKLYYHRQPSVAPII